MRRYLAIMLVGLLILVGCSSTIRTLPEVPEVETFEGGTPLGFHMGTRLQEALQHAKVRALFSDLPPEESWSPDILVTCLDYHKLSEVLKYLGYSEAFIGEVFYESIL